MALQTAPTSGGQTQGSPGDIPHSNNNILLLLYYILYDIIIIIIITKFGTRPDYVGPGWPGTIESFFSLPSTLQCPSHFISLLILTEDFMHTSFTCFLEHSLFPVFSFFMHVYLQKKV